MARIKLNFRRLSVTEKIAKAQQIVAAVTGNASFPSPTPALATVTTSVNDLAAAHAAAQAAKQDAKTRTSALNEKEDIVDKLMSQLAAYVEAVAGDDEKIILSAGLGTRSPSVASSGAPPAPNALTATAGDHDGEIDLSWEPAAGTKSYIIEKSPDPPTATSWTHAGVSTKSRTAISSLTPGTRYWFRVSAVGTSGQSGWSDPATKIAP